MSPFLPPYQQEKEQANHQDQGREKEPEEVCSLASDGCFRLGLDLLYGGGGGAGREDEIKKMLEEIGNAEA